MKWRTIPRGWILQTLISLWSSCLWRCWSCDVIVVVFPKWTTVHVVFDARLSPFLFLCTESSPSSVRGPMSSRSIQAPRRTGFPPVNTPSPSPTSSTVPGMFIESSAWMDPRCANSTVCVYWTSGFVSFLIEDPKHTVNNCAFSLFGRLVFILRYVNPRTRYSWLFVTVVLY